MNGIIIPLSENEVRNLIRDEIERVFVPEFTLISRTEAAVILRCSPATVANYEGSGLLKNYSTRNEHNRYKASEVIELSRKERKKINV